MIFYKIIFFEIFANLEVGQSSKSFTGTYQLLSVCQIKENIFLDAKLVRTELTVESFEKTQIAHPRDVARFPQVS